MFEFTWDIDPIAFHVLGWPIRYYGLVFLAVFLGGYQLFRWQVKRAGGSEDDATDIFVPAILGVLIGARLGHVIFYEPMHALHDPLWIFQIWKGGLASHGATLGLLVAIWWYARHHKQSYIESLDRFALSAGLGATLVRFGNFLNSEIVGRATDQSWGVRFPRCIHDHHLHDIAQVPLRHPSQLYEFTLGLFVMFTIWLMDRLLGREKRPRGALIATFFAVYFPGRFLVEFFKEYQTGGRSASGLGLMDGLTMGQILSIPLALLGIFGLAYSIHKKVPAHWNVEAPEPVRKGPRPKKRRRR